MNDKVLYSSHLSKTANQAQSYVQTAECAYRYLGYRDLPLLIKKYAKGSIALDYGSGTGISTHFLASNGLSAFGVDTDIEMIKQAQKNYPGIDFSLLENGLLPVESESCDVVFSSFVLFELSSKDAIRSYLEEAKRVLKKTGVFLIVTGSDSMYKKKWRVFHNDYDENKNLKSGGSAKVMVPELNLEFLDYYWTENDYTDLFAESGLHISHTHYPLGKEDEPYEWRNELHHSPFVIFALEKNT
jgi:ubiquinone/menaquinone biosynthesis C-methylase UbiE